MSKEKELKKEIDKLKQEILMLNKTLEEYGIEEYSPITDVEIICTKGIQDLKALSEEVGLTENDAKVLDLLHKNIRLARGKFEKKEPRGKINNPKDLIKIVSGSKKV